MRIRHELSERGVSEALASEYLAAQGLEWRRAAMRARARRFGEAPPGDARESARQRRFLFQRGFDDEQIRYALRAGGARDDDVDDAVEPV